LNKILGKAFFSVAEPQFWLFWPETDTTFEKKSDPVMDPTSKVQSHEEFGDIRQLDVTVSLGPN
jgi:hypothetical protein